MEEKEIELIDYLSVIWKRKWIIIIGTVLCMIIAGAVSFILKPVYEIDAIIQPGKFFVENEAGNFEEFVVEDPQQIADKVRHRSYDTLVAVELDLDVAELPEIKGENIRDTLLTRIWVRDHDVELSKKILDSLIVLLKKDIDMKIDIEINNVNAAIKANEIEKERRINQIEILKKKLRIIDQRKKDIIKEMDSVKIKINELEKEQLKVLKKENRTEIESLGMLLYSNEIQQSLRYNDLLNEKLSNEKLKEGNVNSDLQVEYASINKIDNTIVNLNERKGRIDYTKVIKVPTSSVNPISPKKMLKILVVGILALIIFTLLNFFLEYIERKRLEN